MDEALQWALFSAPPPEPTSVAYLLRGFEHVTDISGQRARFLGRRGGFVNRRLGAALNALQIAEELVKRNLI